MTQSAIDLVTRPAPQEWASPARVRLVPPAVPFVSVIVRSYCRPQPLLELVSRLLDQDHPAFEVVIFEQSDDSELLRCLESLNASKLRVVAAPATNAPAARNAAIRHAVGDIFLFIDDDDLPLGKGWIKGHVANYSDPLCMGVVGRLVSDPQRLQGPRFPRFIRALAMRHTIFKDTRAYAHNTLPKKGIDFLIGSNASVRRSLVERIGGWDEGIPMNEEQSFAIKFARMRNPGQYFQFDPGPMIWRRTDVPGGLARRSGDAWHLREFEARLFYYRHVVGYYFPLRYRLLYPLFLLRALVQVLEWIWDPDNRQRAFRERLTASVDLLLRAPTALRGHRFDCSQVRRVPAWP
jgi:glycosyltransferase involved in cell wall biosynthesis